MSETMDARFERWGVDSSVSGSGVTRVSLQLDQYRRVERGLHIDADPAALAVNLVHEAKSVTLFVLDDTTIGELIVVMRTLHRIENHGPCLRDENSILHAPQYTLGMIGAKQGARFFCTYNWEEIQFGWPVSSEEA
jgi:hypothetical protein